MQFIDLKAQQALIRKKIDANIKKDPQTEISKKIGMVDQDPLNQVQANTTKVIMVPRGLIRSLKQRQS